MKKIFLLVAAVMMIGLGNINAQAPAAKTTTTTTKHVTKSGAPDKRFKENKTTSTSTAAKPAGPMKKDGTPDMRYKENKTTTTRKTVQSAK